MATCYRITNGSITPNEIKDIRSRTEEQIQVLFGNRFEQFCNRFARFCKLDYGLRFFTYLMRKCVGKYPNSCGNMVSIDALNNMIIHTCAILTRIVDDYGRLVDVEQGVSTLIGVDMARLMNPLSTGDSICNALWGNPARALWWITDEIGIWLYGI